MKSITLTTQLSLVIAVAFSVSCATKSDLPQKSKTANFSDVKVASIYDGDSFKVSIKNTHPIFGENIGIRVFGIDTPERRTKNQCEKSKALEAKKIVENALLSASRIDLKDCIRGKYFRLVCRVQYDGKSLTKLLEDRKLGYPYFGKTKKKINWCDGPESLRIPASKRIKQE